MLSMPTRPVGRSVASTPDSGSSAPRTACRRIPGRRRLQ
jgi:hypothetical protein